MIAVLENDEPDIMNETAQTPVQVTDSAIRRTREIIEAEGGGERYLRVSVLGGGCSGFQYSFALDDHINDDDTVIERDGVKVLVDAISLPFLTGAEIDFVEELVGSAFRVHNPNATASCGCGTSFSI